MSHIYILTSLFVVYFNKLIIHVYTYLLFWVCICTLSGLLKNETFLIIAEKVYINMEDSKKE